MDRRWTLVTAPVAAAAAGLTGYAAYRAGARRWRADEQQLVAAGLSPPGDLEHHFVATDDGGRLHVVERGEGPPLLLVHGVALSATVWAYQLRQLSGTRRVLAMDVRGHGQSLAGAGGFSMDRLAEDVLTVLRALGVRQAVLAGHSMGGMIALRLASRWPGELSAHASALALVATQAGPLVTGPGHAWRAQRMASLTRQGLRASEHLGLSVRPTGDLASWVARVAFGRHPRPEHVELARSLFSAMSPEALTELVATIVAFDERHQVGAITLPTLIVVGGRDLLTPVRSAQLLQRSIAGSVLVRLPGAGHMLMLERAQELNELLADMASASVPATA
jgi:pimeloyl-ACP methyl ester carboxylesterase